MEADRDEGNVEEQKEEQKEEQREELQEEQKEEEEDGSAALTTQKHAKHEDL